MKSYKIQDFGTSFSNSGWASLRRTLVRSVNNWAKQHSAFHLLIFLLLFCLSSCTKVITLQLKEGAPQLVIEGSVSNIDSLLPEVRVSQTKHFSDSNSFMGISGATVSITVNNSTEYILHEDSTGVFHSHQFLGAPGNTYSLKVAINGATYSAVSTMPADLVTLDSIWVQNFAFGGSNNLTIYPEYTDPPGLGNNYRLVEFKNGVQVNTVFEENDELSDGLTITRPLINPDGNLSVGDTVRVDLQCIDPYVYDYWFSADQSATGNNQSATPTNPVTNIVGGALGVFNAYSVSSRVIVVK